MQSHPSSGTGIEHASTTRCLCSCGTLPARLLYQRLARRPKRRIPTESGRFFSSSILSAYFTQLGRLDQHPPPYRLPWPAIVSRRSERRSHVSTMAAWFGEIWGWSQKGQQNRVYSQLAQRRRAESFGPCSAFGSTSLHLTYTYSYLLFGPVRRPRRRRMLHYERRRFSDCRYSAQLRSNGTAA
ncbi:hypothetical protein K490DRAFT_53943 [Saccharata proteae CBS 121410]|uniref:Uncharacterized protein n=1 Tax=Saccharata proteae CBS 121410 TaxID=1314787 RepID=A0A9P4I2K3_9PEZI|nr:hypothetical protein K490DRAFT_53943 [Saccharata proteae CBS 121410]